LQSFLALLTHQYQCLCLHCYKHQHEIQRSYHKSQDHPKGVFSGKCSHAKTIAFSSEKLNSLSSSSQNELQVLHLNRQPCLNLMKIHFSTFSYGYFFALHFQCLTPTSFKTNFAAFKTMTGKSFWILSRLLT
jgi:hypothetical protein